MPEEMVLLRELLDKKQIYWVDDTTDRSECFPFLDLSIYRTKFKNNGHSYLVISGYGTYGGDYGLLELSIDSKDPIGRLTHEEVMEWV